MKRKFRILPRLSSKWILLFAVKLMILALCAGFFDWLVLNAISQCCEGGVCIPDIYPQCRNPHYDEVYGEGYYDQHTRK